MKTAFHNMLMLAGTVAGLCCTARSANGADSPNILFIDGGYAEFCSIAAFNIGEKMKIEITGSRIDLSQLELCTLAIRNGSGDASIFNLASSYNNRGVLLFAQGSLAEALSDFEQAIRLQETLGEAHVNRGYTLAALMRWADSIVSFDRGIALGTAELAKAHFNRGIAYEEVGKIREAYYDYLKAAELDPVWEEPKRELTRFTVRRQ